MTFRAGTLSYWLVFLFVYLFVSVAGPLGVVWAINTLLGTHAPYTLQGWASVIILGWWISAVCGRSVLFSKDE
jgi:hypothetical protein